MIKGQLARELDSGKSTTYPLDFRVAGIGASMQSLIGRWQLIEARPSTKRERDASSVWTESDGNNALRN